MREHPTDDALVAFADGDATGIDDGAIRQHVERCDACAATVAALRDTRLSVHRAAAASPPPPFRGDWNALAARIESRRTSRLRALRLAMVGIAAAVVVTATLLARRSAELRRDAPVAAMRRVVHDIDNAIAETRAALATDPTDASLRNHLAALQRKRVSAEAEMTSFLRDRG